MLLDGRVVLVTGASRGIGAATARILASRGSSVVCAGRDEAALRSVAEPLGASVVGADLAHRSAPAYLVEEVVRRHGRLDAVVANAGVGYAGAFTSMSAERISGLVDVNLTSQLLLARAAVPAITSSPGLGGGGGGGLVFVSSIAGAVGVPGESVYSATKAGLDAFAAMLREELRREELRGEPITVGVVAPGVVDTEFFANRGAGYARRFPRPMSADRVARVVVRALERGTERVVEPRWLALPAWLSAALPALYRPLARRFS